MKTFDEFYEDTKIISEMAKINIRLGNATYNLDISDMPTNFIKQYQNAAKSKGIKFFSGRQPDGSRGSGFHPGPEYIRFEGEYNKLKHFVMNSIGETEDEFEAMVEARMMTSQDMTDAQRKAVAEIAKTSEIIRSALGAKGSVDIWLKGQSLDTKPAHTIDVKGNAASYDMQKGGNKIK